MTPNAIEILIHCHCCPLPHPRKDAPEVVEEFESLRLNGLIKMDNQGIFRTTDRGMAHIEQLCRTAWPTQAWIGENGRIIDLGA